MVWQSIRQFRGMGFGVSVALMGMSPLMASGLAQEQHPLTVAQVPDLVRMYSQTRQLGSFGDRYKLFLRLPSTLQRNIQRIEIEQQTGVQQIQFLLPRTQAQLEQGRQETPLPLRTITQAQDNGTISIPFASPVAWSGAEEQLLIILYPRKNPSFGGDYQFKVTAVTDQERLFLGFGRLQLYTPAPL